MFANSFKDVFLKALSGLGWGEIPNEILSPLLDLENPEIENFLFENITRPFIPRTEEEFQKRLNCFKIAEVHNSVKKPFFFIKLLEYFDEEEFKKGAVEIGNFYLADDISTEFRSTACMYFEDFPDKNAIEPLINILETDPSPTVRESAARVLYVFDDERVTKALTLALEDSGLSSTGYTVGDSASTSLEYIAAGIHEPE
jgi:hypothetical protein